MPNKYVHLINYLKPMHCVVAFLILGSVHCASLVPYRVWARDNHFARTHCCMYIQPVFIC